MDELSQIGLGTYKNTDPEQCSEIVSTAVEMGYRHIDTAQAYDNETYVGDGIERADVNRDDVFLATKVWDDTLAYDDVLSSTNESLDRLGVERLDLLYVHWPRDTYDAEETLPAFDELHDKGTIEHVGLSNFTPEQLDEARDTLDAPIFAHQVEMHPLLQQEELQEYAREDDHWLVAYAPIARGEVTEIDEIQAVAEKHDATPHQVSLAWLAAKENVVAIPKTSSEAHLQDNFEAQELALDEDDIEAIDAIEREERLIDPDDAPWNR
ncbi:aldehyde oxidoreductase [Haladaptatus sp. W1]|uniref:aldo/keto reductase n=1 Tax=Haladaptatus sp. W1 TaxID=1897478 RepID=UPI000849E2CF|nr:aldo/keto reductase [Haladaptatus sp. W1]ODR80580.1 aldehyde oxidoreductase [Haladaptatus sp. W1]